MNLTTFLTHWGLSENPFVAEEARDDPVFARLDAARVAHPDFDKVIGDLSRGVTSVVFGEKGAGKTAIRLQLAERVAEHNLASPDSKVFFLPIDDLDPTLDRFATRHGASVASASKSLVKVLAKLRLADHQDALLHLAVSRLCTAVVDRQGPLVPMLPANPGKALASMPLEDKRRFMQLHALYAEPSAGAVSDRKLRKMLRVPFNAKRAFLLAVSMSGWLPGAAVAFMAFTEAQGTTRQALLYVAAALGLAWFVVFVKTLFWESWRTRARAHKLAARARTTPRDADEIAAALPLIPVDAGVHHPLFSEDSEAARYDMTAALTAVLARLGFTSIMVVYDRLDEPTLVNGDPVRMRSIVWPLLNNKFLQQPGFAVKLLLPAELRHELFRERSSFFQEARLDKQNLVERLSWTGSMLYDLCNARIAACKSADVDSVSLSDIFAEEVARADLVDALDQMRHPRDAFKLIYRCLHEHCAAVSAEDNAWRVPKWVLETVKREQADRVQQFARGIRPA